MDCLGGVGAGGNAGLAERSMVAVDGGLSRWGLVSRWFCLDQGNDAFQCLVQYCKALLKSLALSKLGQIKLL